MKGTIARKVDDKGFGFIKPEEGDKDIFFHAKSVVGTTFEELNEGDVVTFEVVDGDKGPAANDVELAGGASDAADEEMAA